MFGLALHEKVAICFIYGHVNLLCPQLVCFIKQRFGSSDSMARFGC